MANIADCGIMMQVLTEVSWLEHKQYNVTTDRQSTPGKARRSVWFGCKLLGSDVSSRRWVAISIDQRILLVNLGKTCNNARTIVSQPDVYTAMQLQKMNLGNNVHGKKVHGKNVH